MRTTVFIILICVAVVIPGGSYAKSGFGKCADAIEKNTGWSVKSALFSGANIQGTPAGFSELIKKFCESTPYKTERVDYKVEGWRIFGVVLSNYDGSSKKAFLYAAPDTDRRINGSTIFSAVPKESDNY